MTLTLYIIKQKKPGVKGVCYKAQEYNRITNARKMYLLLEKQGP